jgi:iron-sulfur cluster insertion protein
MNQINVTESAVLKITELLAEEGNPKLKLRTFVQGGGCSGFQYGFTFDEEQTADDFVIERTGMTILIDAMSMQYMLGATIDYKEDIMGSSFNIINPQAESTCGCGSSFAI